MTDAGGTDRLELQVGAIAAGGGCVARAPDGRVVFVRHCLPGERVLARITATNKSFHRADAVEILEASPDRVTPPCAHAGPGRCGGCDFQHINLAAQRRLKAALIAEQLQRLAGVTRGVRVDAMPGDTTGLGWRTRVRLAVDEAGRVGFRQHRSHDLEYVTECPIALPSVMATGAFEADWSESGVNSLEVIAAPTGTEALVAARTSSSGGSSRGGRDRAAGGQERSSGGRDGRDGAGRSAVTLPPVHAGTSLNGRTQRRPEAVHPVVGGHTFRVSAGVFWQVHAGAATALAGAVRGAMKAQRGDRVVDLYAGAGLFSVLLANDVGPTGSVRAIERDRKACLDAEHNGRQFSHLDVQRASVTPALVERGIGRPDLVVLDPAREGAGREIMEALRTHETTLRRLVYVACEPSSFSRDIRVLLDARWTLTSLRAFDIFPMTEHVEIVACLEPPH